MVRGRHGHLTGQQSLPHTGRPAGQPGSPGHVHFQTSTTAVCAVFSKAGPAGVGLALWPVRGFTHPLDLALMPLCGGSRKDPGFRAEGLRPTSHHIPPSQWPSGCCCMISIRAHPSTRRFGLPLPTRALSSKPSKGSAGPGPPAGPELGTHLPSRGFSQNLDPLRHVYLQELYEQMTFKSLSSSEGNVSIFTEISLIL